MAFDARECFGKSRIRESLDRFRIEIKSRRCSLPDRPRARGFQSNVLVIAGQTAIVSADHVTALILRNHLQVLFPDVGKDPTAALLIEPFDLFRPAEKDSAQDKFGRAIGMLLGVSKRQSAAPRPAKYLPLLDAEMFAQLLNIGDQIPRCVFFDRSMRRALARASLIEEHNAISRRIVKLPIFRCDSATWTTVQKHDRLAVRVSALFVINLVKVRDF